MIYVQKRSFLYYIALAIALLQCIPASYAMEPKRPALRIVQTMRNPQAGQLSTTVRSVQVAITTAAPVEVRPNKGAQKLRKKQGKKAPKSTSSSAAAKKRAKLAVSISHTKELEGSLPSRSKSEEKRIRKFLQGNFGIRGKRSQKTDHQEGKSRHGYPKPLFEGIIRSETDEAIIIDDPSNRQCIKINKTQPVQDTAKILKSARGLRYSARVRDWFNRPNEALVEGYRLECKKYGIKPKDYIRVDVDSKINRKSYAMHRFSKLVDLFLCYGERINETGGNFRYVIKGSVADLHKTEEWRPCIFVYVFDGRTRDIFHRGMKILEVEKADGELSAPETSPALCLDDI